MFKKGQLVKCADGEHGIIELKSNVFPGEYVVTVKKVRGVNSVVYVGGRFSYSTRSRGEAFDHCCELTKLGFNAEFKSRTASNRDARADDS